MITKIKIKELPIYYAKVKNDAGYYRVWGIDNLNRTIIVYRAMEYQTLSFDRIQYLMLEEDYFKEVETK